MILKYSIFCITFVSQVENNQANYDCVSVCVCVTKSFFWWWNKNYDRLRSQREMFNEIGTQNDKQEEVLRDRFYGFWKTFSIGNLPEKWPKKHTKTDWWYWNRLNDYSEFDQRSQHSMRFLVRKVIFAFPFDVAVAVDRYRL